MKGKKPELDATVDDKTKINANVDENNDKVEGGDGQGVKQEAKVTSFADLPLAERDRQWSKRAAESRVRKWASKDGSGEKDQMDWPKYRKAFMWYDSENAEEFTSYKLQYADIIDGELKVVPRAIFAIAVVLQGGRGGVDIPDEDKEKVKSHVEKYYHKMDEKAPWEKSEAYQAAFLRLVELEDKFSAATIEDLKTYFTSLKEIYEMMKSVNSIDFWFVRDGLWELCSTAVESYIEGNLVLEDSLLIKFSIIQSYINGIYYYDDEKSIPLLDNLFVVIESILNQVGSEPVSTVASGEGNSEEDNENKEEASVNEDKDGDTATELDEIKKTVSELENKIASLEEENKKLAAESENYKKANEDLSRSLLLEKRLRIMDGRGIVIPENMKATIESVIGRLTEEEFEAWCIMSELKGSSSFTATTNIPPNPEGDKNSENPYKQIWEGKRKKK